MSLGGNEFHDCQLPPGANGPAIAAVAALVLAVGVVVAGAGTAWADDSGSITIRNTQPEKTYNLYKVFDATYDSPNSDNVAYTYKGTDSTFIAALQADSSPFTYGSSTGVVSLKTGKTAADVTTFLSSQSSHLGEAAKTVTGDGGDLTVSSLPLGYYYVTTTTGSAASLTTTRPSATIVDKNEAGTGPEKKETTAANPSDSDWTKDLTANIGDTVKYRVTGTIQRYQQTNAGPIRVTSLTMVDTMSAGLTPTKDVAIKVTEPDSEERTLTKDTDYTVAYDDTHNTTTIVITTSTGDEENPTFNFKSGTSYEVTYSATLNEQAKVASDDNRNTVEVTYNNNIQQGEDTTQVHTYAIGLSKVDNDNKPLSGAKFKLYTAQTGGTPISLVSTGNTEADPTNQYRVAKSGEQTGAVDEMEVGSNGKLTVSGLKNGTYYFEETVPPNGYNPLAERKSVTVENGNTSIDVQNMKGTVLPSTGGAGTVAFYVVGGVLIVGAVAYLVHRRKANANA